MNKKELLTQYLAIGGTILSWVPILAPILFSVIFIFTRKTFRFDYLMPAELFPFALSGGILLFGVAVRSKSRQKIIGWGLGSAIVFLMGGQMLAVVSGLASGEREPTGIWWFLVLASLMMYTLSIILIGISGIFLLRDLRKPLSM